MSGVLQVVVSGKTQPTLMEAITTAGLTANLLLCLDAGDAASYTSGTKWLDRSGGGYDFLLGSDGTTDAPTFTGGAGNRGAYWTGTSADKYFTYDTTNEAWMETLHKNNAVFTVLMFHYFATGHSGSDNIPALATNGAVDTNIGVYFGANSNGRPRLEASKGSAGFAIAKIGDTTPALDQWHMSAVSLTEATGAGGGFFYTDGSYNQVSSSDTFDSTYSSPSASNATYTMQSAADGNSGGNGLRTGKRIAAVAAWSSALSKANLDSIFALQRARYGI